MDSPDDLNDGISRAEALKEAADARRWRDASPAERIEIEIEDLKAGLPLIRSYLPELAKWRMERIAVLQAELKRLQA